MNSDPQRNQAGGKWVRKAVAYTLSAGAAAMAAGALLGMIGGLIPFDFRLAVGSVFAVAAILVGVLDLVNRSLWLPQRDRETPQRWVHAGALRWALLNGGVLGLGATSRIGFWLWYVVPIGALLVGHWQLGALIFGTYGIIRGGMVWPILLAMARQTSDEPVAHWLLDRRNDARLLASMQLIVVGLAFVFTVGL